MSDDVPVRTEIRERAAIVWLDRPHARNALSAGLRAALHEHVAAADADPAVAAIVVTGSDPAFCAGLDLKELGDQPERIRDLPPEIGALPVPATAKPLIAAVNGPAVTGGLELVLACDFVIASERAVFADTHARIGVMPGWGLTVYLAEAVGRRRARQMSATGNYVDAPTALAWGLVNEVVPHADLLDRCVRLASDVASNDPSAVARMMATYDDLEDGDDMIALRREREISNGWRSTSDPRSVAERRDAVMARGRSQIGDA